jgi:hypothetical protein
MTADAAYTGSPALAPARYLQRAGQWNAALAALPPGQAGVALRADILTDRYGWQLGSPAEAEAAAREAAAAHPELAVLLTAQLEYWRRVLSLGGAPVGTGLIGTGLPAAFQSVTGHDGLGGWAWFWHGVTLDMLEHDQAGAAVSYARALEVALAAGDPLLESYVVRHQAGHAAAAGDPAREIALLRRSAILRAAVGARPHTAAAQATLAEVLRDGEEAADLRRAATRTARELKLAWLAASLAEEPAPAGPQSAR